MISEIVRCSSCWATHPFDAVRCDVCGRSLHPSDAGPTQVSMHPAVRFRFADVVNELRAIAAMASAEAVEPAVVAAACLRAESLLMVLRRQFLDDVVLTDEAPSVRSAWPA